ncbi:hypothetical protein AJ80_01278 [Polytolypa hystricis UAMH7299]|uniref:Uncharacterized protein n=1 Tax=Polytolypa hystricis (strain UAMH7299) TaxID=1447883 RepID=A0A2B7Z185_POLH7|nr:hypothetical protein AJ80_01278 [Polytolypa hystricis UAMH7299]
MCPGWRYIHIRSLPNSPREIRLLEFGEWNQLGYRILADNDVEFEPDNIKKKDIPGSLLRPRYKERRVQGPVHYENQEGVPSLPYIAVSKLSCLACWELAASLRNGDLFHTKGRPHAKASFPWKYPDAEINRAIPQSQAQLSRSFFNNLARTYANRFYEEKMRTRSDSSAGWGAQGRTTKILSIDAFDT